ncbi:hypothetical protein ACP26L_07275 [Paenibacillus sp. S-38]|uniref:hypothetical protein n=1 Tax=Paenibacillus sp. S-38 TaxID=3416710 RepID=UPI003CEE8639
MGIGTSGGEFDRIGAPWISFALELSFLPSCIYASADDLFGDRLFVFSQLPGKQEAASFANASSIYEYICIFLLIFAPFWRDESSDMMSV